MVEYEPLQTSLHKLHTRLAKATELVEAALLHQHEAERVQALRQLPAALRRLSGSVTHVLESMAAEGHR
jgi:hypothetical protein